MVNRSLKAALFLSVLALLLQATVGFAASMACVVECGKPIAKQAQSGHDHCGKPGGEKTKKSAHECNGSCQSIDSTNGTLPQPAATIVAQPLYDLPAILPEAVEVPELTQLFVPGIYCTDSGPPLARHAESRSSRAPPVA